MKKLLPVLFCVMLLVVSCSMVKAPAQLAIKTAEEAMNTVRAEAAKFVPEQLADMEAVLASAKQSFETGDYKAALASAKDIPAKIKDLASAIEAKKAALPQDWQALSTEMPKLIANVKSAVSKARGVDKTVLAEAKTAVDGMPEAWKQAEEEFKAGKLYEAVTRASGIKQQAAKIEASLGEKTAAK
ncbi:hypothetical protein HZA73_05335 [candidate division TA06 bacterium]|nr:hypothetical protein [candidate division TA06 bacterium]